MTELKRKCTLSDKDLIERCSELVSRLCQTGGRSWTMRVPVDFDNDSDMLLCELINRFKKIGCNCSDESKHGETSVMCCNECGKPTETFWIQ